MTRIQTLTLLALAAFSVGCSNSVVPGEASGGGSVWLTSLIEGKEASIKEKKPILIDFRADWCGWCKEYEKTTFVDPQVQELFKRLVLVRIDVDKQPDLGREYQASSLPMLVFADKDGRPFHTISGYIPPSEFVPELEKALAKFKG